MQPLQPLYPLYPLHPLPLSPLVDHPGEVLKSRPSRGSLFRIVTKYI